MDNETWNEFCSEVTNIYNNLKCNNSGNVASYIPQLAKVNPDFLGISIFSIDGRILILVILKRIFVYKVVVKL